MYANKWYDGRLKIAKKKYVYLILRFRYKKNKIIMHQRYEFNVHGSSFNSEVSFQKNKQKFWIFVFIENI